MSDEKQPSEWALAQAMHACPMWLDHKCGETDPRKMGACRCYQIALRIDAGIERGRRLERWDCWDDVRLIALDAGRALGAAYPGPYVRHHCAQECADAINNRGPMLEE